MLDGNYDRRKFLSTCLQSATTVALAGFAGPGLATASPAEGAVPTSPPSPRPYADAYFRKLIKSGLTPCFNIALMKEGKLAYQFTAGHGKPEPNAGPALTSNTRLNIGSVTKPVTGSLIIKLSELGELTLDDPVNKFLKEFKYDQVAIKHLLLHTSGINAWISPPKDKKAFPEFLKQIYAMKQVNPVGQKTEYWTMGYTLLLEIIEKITGQTIEQFAHSYLFQPLGMSQTTYEIERLKEDEFVLPWDGKAPMNIFRHTPAVGDNCLYSTPGDMIRFGQMFLNNGKNNKGQVIFPPGAVNFMMHEWIGGRTPIFWRKGIGDFAFAPFGELNSPDTVGHTGFSGCILFIDPIAATTGVVLTTSTHLHSDPKNYKNILNVLMTF